MSLNYMKIYTFETSLQTTDFCRVDIRVKEVSERVENEK